MSRFDVVLFDLDGTLVDTNQLILASFEHTLREKLGLTVPVAELTKYFGEPLIDTLTRFAPDRVQELLHHYREFNLSNHDSLIRQFAGIKEMLADLAAAGVALAIVTSKLSDTAWRGLRVCGLEEFFTTLVGVDQTAEHKPHPRPALLALERLGKQPGANVLMVGDSRFDILCGRAAGCQSAAVGWSVQDRAALAESAPDYWVDSPAELVKLVLEK